jgi:uncharacterized protein (TIGR02145 family)
MMSIRMRVVAIALTIPFASGGAASVTRHPAQDEKRSGSIHPSKRMADGKQWTTTNLNVVTDHSYCYEDAAANCGKYGRLYTWVSAQQGCRALGDEWRLPTNDEWQQLANHYGGLLEDSDKSGKATFTALIRGGRSGLDIVLGGRRAPDGEYARLEAHGFYWTASETDQTNAWFYNFGTGLSALNRHRDGNKQTALSVRCAKG